MQKRTRTLIRYIVPSAGGLCVTYLYNIVDGMFVGQGVGALALAAVNITVPFITALVAFSSLFAMGGSTIIAIRLGRGDTKGANDAFMTSLLLTLLLSFVLLAVGTLFPEPIARLCGSSEELLPMAKEYLFFSTAFSIPFLLSNCLANFVRNDGAPGLAFAGMCAGAGGNIFLDWLFIFPLQMGIAGAAIASGLGQLFSFALLLSHFVRRRGQLRIGRFRFSGALALEICKRGVPECVSQLNTPVTAFCYNWVLRGTLGDMGVAAFSVLSFLSSLANAVLSGVAQGLQPLWGRAFGCDETEELHALFRTGLRIGLVCGGALYALFFLFRIPLIQLFNRDASLVALTAAALPVFALSFLFMAVNLICTAYFYSTQQTFRADGIAFSRGVLLKAAAIFLLPALLGGQAVWAAAALAEALTLPLCIYRSKRPL